MSSAAVQILSAAWSVSSLALRMTDRPAGLKLFEFGDPELDFGVGWHPEISSGREADRTDLRAVGHAGALELL